MALRRIPIRRIGHRHNLLLGGDRVCVAMLGIVCSALIFNAQELRAAIVGIAFWVVGLYLLRLMAKHDPRMISVWWRSRRYKAYYPPRATPFRENTHSQEWHYR